MKIFALTMSLTAAALLMVTSSAAQAKPVDKYVEHSLVQICKSSMKGNLLNFNRTLKHFRLKDKTVADGVVCNGDDIADFARKHGSYKIANRLKKHATNSTSITDIAKVNKIQVSFIE